MRQEAGTELGRVLAHPLVLRLSHAMRSRIPVEAASVEGMRHAAVAIVLRLDEANALELLMIERATYAGDPWSGHMALPGGRREVGDASLADTAIRETREETAIDLARDGRIIGRLDDVLPNTPVLPRIVISPFVAVVDGRVVLSPSPEVAAAFWIPISALCGPGASREVVLDLVSGSRRVRCFQYEGRTIWGLTERILTQFVALAGAGDG